MLCDNFNRGQANLRLYDPVQAVAPSTGEECNGIARLLANIQTALKRRPSALPANEAAHFELWAGKMLERMARGDVEGDFRRHWLLTDMLPHYFRGSKKSFQWLETHDRTAFKALSLAYKPGAFIRDIKAADDIVCKR